MQTKVALFDRRPAGTGLLEGGRSLAFLPVALALRFERADEASMTMPFFALYWGAAPVPQAPMQVERHGVAGRFDQGDQTPVSRLP